MDLSSKKTFFLLTGASKGIGKCMAIECSKKLPKGSLVVLLARTASGLEQTKTEIEQSNAAIKVKTIPMDLSKSNADDYEQCLEQALDQHSANDFERAFIIHNVGSLGDVTQRAKQLNDNNEWSDYFHLNVFSVAALNSRFIKRFADLEKIIVNVTSKCALEPFNSFTYYCAGKAAREMYFRCLAAEENTPDVCVLNYSPGPVDTNMTVEILNNSADDNIKTVFSSMRANKQILSTMQTTTKFIQVLEEKKFKSGDHIDYFD